MNLLEKLAGSYGKVESSDHLELLGKRATGLFLSKKASSLNDAVAQVATQEGNLNNDQIRRVSEMANQAAWKELFVTQGTKDASFDPADSDEVLSDLAVEPGQVVDPNTDYLMDVPGELPPDTDFNALFGLEGDVPDYPALNPLGEVEATQQKVAAAQDLVLHGQNRVAHELEQMGEQFYQLFKQAHVRDGFGVCQMASSIGDVLESEQFAQHIMQNAAKRLQDEGVKINPAAEQEKLAHPVVLNTNHPLVLAAGKLEKLAAAYANTLVARENLGKTRSRVDQYIRDKIRGT